MSNIDKALQVASTRLFQIDETSRGILSHVALAGPSTIYELYKSMKGVSKSAIHRRIHGDANILSLLSEGFIRQEGVADFSRIDGRKKKYYGLTLKGFLAALSKTRCERVYMFEIFERAFESEPTVKDVFSQKREKQRERLWRSLRNRIKHDLMVFLQYHLENGFQLTELKHPNLYFLIFWDQILPFNSRSHPFYSKRAPYFSTEWEKIWKDRIRSIEETKTSVMISQANPKSGIYHRKRCEIYLGESPYPPGWDWVGVFNSCWFTRIEDTNHFGGYLFCDFLPIIEAYKTVMGRLRGGEIPWQVEEIIAPDYSRESPAVDNRTSEVRKLNYVS